MAVKMMVELNAARIIPPHSRQTRQVFTIVTVIFFLHAIIHPTTAVARRSGGEYTGDLVNRVICQEDTLTIRCQNSSYAISIYSATYGRTETGITVCPYVGDENDFYFNCGENQVTDKLIQKCKRKKKCVIKAAKAVFGDPCNGHAYLSIVYSCVKKKRRKNKKPKPPKTLPTTNTLHSTNATNISSTLNYTMNLTSANTTTITTEPGWNPSPNSTLINNNVGNVLSAKKNGSSPGILMSIIIWVVCVTNNGQSFMTVFLITLGSATFFFLAIFGLMVLHKRFKDKRRRKKKLENSDREVTQQKLNIIMSSNCDAKKNSDLDTFPAPPPALPPPPDDMMYPSPTPDMINLSRPPPPPNIRGRSLDDISKVGQDTRKHVPVTRSISLRTTRPPDYQHKEVNFDKLPKIDSAGEIQAVIIQRNNGSTMYMNPMYENGHVKEATC